MADFADHADIHIERELEALLQAQRQRTASNALPASMDGRCMECGADIGEARRRALPKTGRCIDCARLAEHCFQEHAWRSP